MVCGSFEAPVPRPQTSACGQPDRREQMSIDIAEATPKEEMSTDEVKNFSIGRDIGLRQVLQSPDNLIAPR